MTAEPASTWPWPAPVDDGGARHLVPGLPLPDIALSATYATGASHPPGTEASVGTISPPPGAETSVGTISPSPGAETSVGTLSPPPCGEGAGVGVKAALTHPGSINLATRAGTSVVFVYPWTGRAGLPNPPDWDLIPGAHGSTPEAEGFRDLEGEFQALGAAIFGLSTQDAEHHAELASRLALPYPLLSDAGIAFTRALRLPTFATGGVTYLKRLTLVIRDGRLAHAFYPVHPPDTHARALLNSLSPLLRGESQGQTRS